jgi:CrcB protein
MSAPAAADGSGRRGFPLLTLGLVVAGGALGVLARIALLLPFGDPSLLPWATAVLNVGGSVLLGVVVGWLGGRHPHARAFLGTGVLGGFTTYSAFSVQTVGIATADLGAAVTLVIASLGAGVAGAVAGLFIGRRIADVPGEIEPPEQAE